MADKALKPNRNTAVNERKPSKGQQKKRTQTPIKPCPLLIHVHLVPSFVGAVAQDEALNISGCADVAEAASFFLDRGVGLVVVTRGGGGAFAVSKGGAAGGGGSGSDCRDGGGGGLQRQWEQQCVPVEVSENITLHPEDLCEGGAGGRKYAKGGG